MAYLRPQDEDTICALATPPGEGALALVRISGSHAAKIVQKICPFLLKKRLQSHRVYFGTLVDPFKKKDVDEVLVTYFKQGRSFTGEESLEISCHGGIFLSSTVLDLLVKAGARVAERGEFSYRAFMLGQLDLVQAESILSLIQSRSPKAHTQALRGLKGSISNYLKKIETDLLKLLSHLEASIDFSDQDIQPFSVKQQQKLLSQLIKTLQKGLISYTQGRINQEGFCVVLSGTPNAGKSSLFNCLLQEDKAIVAKMAGTTRDVLSARALFNQTEFCIKDTAGFRKNPNAVEREGIKRACQEIATAELCLFLVECSLPFRPQSLFGLEKQDLSKTVIVFSKSDKLNLEERKKFSQKVDFCLNKRNISMNLFKLRQRKINSCTNKKDRKMLSYVWISSHTGEEIQLLKKLFYEKARGSVQDIFIFSVRQKDSLEKISRFLDQAALLLTQGASSEIIALELQSALMVLYALLGKEYNEEVIQQIFKEFCIGK